MAVFTVKSYKISFSCHQTFLENWDGGRYFIYFLMYYEVLYYAIYGVTISSVKYR